MLKDRDVLEGFSIQTAEQVCRDLHKLNRIVQSLRNKLGATVVIPQSELHIDASQTHTLIKLAIMSLCQNSSGLDVEAGARPDCDAEACAMATECEELVKSLGARFEGDARITPATALRTLAAARRHFGVAVLERIGLGGRSVAAEDELEPAPLLAVTLNEYEVPLVSPVMTHGELAQVAVRPPGDEVTV